jgi:hypothetical protein
MPYILGPAWVARGPDQPTTGVTTPSELNWRTEHRVGSSGAARFRSFDTYHGPVMAVGSATSGLNPIATKPLILRDALLSDADAIYVHSVKALTHESRTAQPSVLSFASFARVSATKLLRLFCRQGQPDPVDIILEHLDVRNLA